MLDDLCLSNAQERVVRWGPLSRFPLRPKSVSGLKTLTRSSQETGKVDPCVVSSVFGIGLAWAHETVTAAGRGTIWVVGIGRPRDRALLSRALQLVRKTGTDVQACVPIG